MNQQSPAKIEVKFAIDAQDAEKAMVALGLDVPPAENRVIHFFETPKFALFERGVILRARQTIVGDEDDDFTFKVRGPAAPGIAADFVAAATSAIKFEGDRTAGREEQASFSITTKPGVASLDTVVAGGQSVENILEDCCKALLVELTRTLGERIALSPLGPIQSKTWKLKLPGFEGKISAELWSIGETQLLEISDKKMRAEASAFEVALVQFLTTTINVKQLDTSKTLFAFNRLM